MDHQEIIRETKKIPISDSLGLNITALDEGFCEMTAPRESRYDGVFRSFHGGLLMTVADNAACCAIITLTGLEARMATSDMNIRFFAPCLTGVTARARVVNQGQKMSLVSVDLFDDSNRLVATAQVNYVFVNGNTRPAKA